MVMGIMAAIMSFGFYALTAFRRGRQVDDMAYALVDLIKNARAKSMSASVGTASAGKWPVAYQVVIDDAEIKVEALYGSVASYTEWDGSYSGSPEVVFSQENSYAELKYGNALNDNECPVILFESINGRMHMYEDFNFATEIPSSDDCYVSFDVAGTTRTVLLNSGMKMFEIQ